MNRIILILFSLISLCFSQDFVDGWQFLPSAKDTIDARARSVMNDSVRTPGIFDVMKFGATANNGTNQSANIQAVIDRSDAYNIIIGHSLLDTFLIRQPILLTSAHSYKIIEINGYLKIMDGDSCSLLADADSGDTHIVVSNSGLFEIGDLICVTDTTQLYGGGQSVETTTNQPEHMGDISTITAIGNDTLYISDPLLHYFSVDSLGMVGTCNSTFILIGADNMTFTGGGVLDGNIGNQFNHSGFELDDVFVDGEHVIVRKQGNQKASLGITAFGCDYLTIENLTVKDFQSMNINVKYSDHHLLRNLKVSGAHDKNILDFFNDYGTIEYCYVEGARWEDGIILYSNNTNISVIGNVCENNNRSGLTLGGSSKNIRSIGNVYRNNGCNIRGVGNAFTSIGDHCIGGGIWNTRSPDDDDHFSSVYIYDSSNGHFIDLKVDSSQGFAGIDIQQDCSDILISGGWVRHSDLGIRIRKVGTKIPKNITLNNFEISNNTTGIDINPASTGIILSNLQMKHNTNFYYHSPDSTFKTLIQSKNISIINSDSLWRDGDNIFNDRIIAQRGLGIGSEDHVIETLATGIDSVGGTDVESLFLTMGENIFKIPTAIPRTWLFSENFITQGGWSKDESGGGTVTFGDNSLGFYGENLLLADSCYIDSIGIDTVYSGDTWMFFVVKADSFWTANNRWFIMTFAPDAVTSVLYVQTGAQSKTLRLRHGTISSSYTSALQDSTLYYFWIRYKPSTGANDGEAALYYSTDGIRPQDPQVLMNNGNSLFRPNILRLRGLLNNNVRYDYWRIDNKEIKDMVFH